MSQLKLLGTVARGRNTVVSSFKLSGLSSNLPDIGMATEGQSSYVSFDPRGCVEGMLRH